MVKKRQRRCCPEYLCYVVCTNKKDFRADSARECIDVQLEVECCVSQKPRFPSSDAAHKHVL